MYCPNPACSESSEHPRLALAERRGVEIDYCPRCRGVWLDRGELEKLIELAAQQPSATNHAGAPTNYPPTNPTPGYVASSPYPAAKPHYEHDKHHYHYKKHKKHSLLGELFDFD